MHEHHSHNHTDENELIALLRYLVKHNTEHTSELEELCSQTDSDEIKALIGDAVSDYSKGNEKLAQALKKAEE